MGLEAKVVGPSEFVRLLLVHDVSTTQVLKERFENVKKVRSLVSRWLFIPFCLRSIRQ